jgi:hypothetical protein
MAWKTRTLLAVAIGSLAILGCSKDDPRLKNLNAGISKDSALAVLGGGTGERPESYLVKGQMIEAVMVRREGVEGPLDSLPKTDYNPVVIINGKLAGWGWEYFDSLSQEIGVTQHTKPVKKKNRD